MSVTLKGAGITGTRRLVNKTSDTIDAKCSNYKTKTPGKCLQIEAQSGHQFREYCDQDLWG